MNQTAATRTVISATMLDRSIVAQRERKGNEGQWAAQSCLGKPSTWTPEYASFRQWARRFHGAHDPEIPLSVHPRAINLDDLRFTMEDVFKMKNNLFKV